MCTWKKLQLGASYFHGKRLLGLIFSHSSVKGSVTPKYAAPGALNRHVHWESQETPIALSHLSASCCSHFCLLLQLSFFFCNYFVCVSVGMCLFFFFLCPLPKEKKKKEKRKKKERKKKKKKKREGKKKGPNSRLIPP